MWPPSCCSCVGWVGLSFVGFVAFLPGGCYYTAHSWVLLHFFLVAVITLLIRGLRLPFPPVAVITLLLYSSVVLFLCGRYCTALCAVLCVVGCTIQSFVAVLSSLTLAASILYKLVFVKFKEKWVRSAVRFSRWQKDFSTLVNSLLIARNSQVNRFNTVFILILILLLSFSNC